MQTIKQPEITEIIARGAQPKKYWRQRRRREAEYNSKRIISERQKDTAKNQQQTRILRLIENTNEFTIGDRKT